MTEVSAVIWLVTIVAIIGLLAFDFFFHVRQAHVPTLKEAAVWSAIYVGIALIFGVLVFVFGGSIMGVEYMQGYVLEKALSVDNLFVFLVIITSFKVPREDQQKVLLFGIVFALIMRSLFIFAGKALIDNLQWIFYIFGLVLIATAVHMMMPEKEDKDEANNFMIRIVKRFMHTSDHYDGDKLFTYENGRRVLTPMLLVMIAIGATDILFAFDSIPAIYGVTENVYLVFTATAFSLMGLRQLYFLIDGFLDRLVYLKYGLTLILGFIGVKLILHALHENEVPFINGGENVPVREIGPYESLAVIVGLLVVTVIASVLSPKGKALSKVNAQYRAANDYVDPELGFPADERRAKYDSMVELESTIAQLNPKHVAAVKKEDHDAVVARARELHDAGQ